MGEGERQLPKTASCNTTSLKADAVGDGFEYSDIDGRPIVGMDNVMEGLTWGSSSISSIGVAYDRSSSSENNGDARKRLFVDGRADSVLRFCEVGSSGGDMANMRCPIDSG